MAVKPALLQAFKGRKRSIFLGEKMLEKGDGLCYNWSCYTPITQTIHPGPIGS